MLLRLGQIRTAHERHEGVCTPEAFTSDQETFKVAGPVTLTCDIYKDKATFHLVGSARARLELSCSRCVEFFTWSVDAAFNLRYRPHADNAGEGEREIEEDDLSTAFYENDTIDLRQLIREQLYLSLPMKPVCRNDCQGLCPVCGTNLNRGTCDCKREWEDPRLAVLEKLKTNS